MGRVSAFRGRLTPALTPATELGSAGPIYAWFAGNRDGLTPVAKRTASPLPGSAGRLGWEYDTGRLRGEDDRGKVMEFTLDDFVADPAGPLRILRAMMYSSARRGEAGESGRYRNGVVAAA